MEELLRWGPLLLMVVNAVAAAAFAVIAHSLVSKEEHRQLDTRVVRLEERAISWTVAEDMRSKLSIMAADVKGMTAKIDGMHVANVQRMDGIERRLDMLFEQQLDREKTS